MKKISANCYRGVEITSTDEIGRLANEKKPIYHINWGLKPAAVLQMMQYKSIYDSVKKRQLFHVINSCKK